MMDYIKLMQKLKTIWLKLHYWKKFSIPKFYKWVNINKHRLYRLYGT